MGSVQVDYLNTPLEWQYLNQYHGLKHPLSYTRLGQQFGLGYNHNSQLYNNRNLYRNGYQSPTTHVQGYAANHKSYGASHQSPTTHVQGYAANHQSYGQSHQSPTTHVQGYATNHQSYGALQRSPNTHVQGYAANHQSHGASQVGYGKSVEQTTYPNGYRQLAQNSYEPIKVYEQNSYITNAGPKQPAYVQVTAPKTQADYQNENYQQKGQSYNQYGQTIQEQTGYNTKGYAPKAYNGYIYSNSLPSNDNTNSLPTAHNHAHTDQGGTGGETLMAES